MKNFVKPITVGCSDGNGIVVGDLFITAGHVANRGKTIYLNIEGDVYLLDKNNELICLEDGVKEDGLYNDCAVYKLNKRYNELIIDGYVPNVGDVLQSISCKHSVEKQSTGGVGVFETQYNDCYEFHTSRATVVDIIGNFIICAMEKPLEEGRSGSPLFYDNQVVGILHGGIEGKTCIFQSIASIQQALLQDQ